MSNEVIKVPIVNRLLDEYGKDIQSQCLDGCVSRGDANKAIFAINLLKSAHFQRNCLH